MSNLFDIAVIGAGIAGVSAAAALAPHARVALIETESQPGYHSTGRSAAILAQTYGSAAVRALTRASDDFLNAPPDGFAQAPLLTPRTLLRIARADQVEGLRHMYDGLEDTGVLRWVEREEIELRVPILRPGYATAGFLNAHAQDIDVHAMTQGYLRQFRDHGGVLITNAPVTGIARSGSGWSLRAGATHYGAGLVVNAAGAWADEIAEMAGLSRTGLLPMRRSALTFQPPATYDPRSLPMIVDAEELFYLKPEAGLLLASPADETLSPACDSRPEELDIAICIDRIMSAFDVSVRKVEAKWSGLRTFSPDRNPICGFAKECETFFWLAGQGGFGIQTAPAMAQLTAHQVLGIPLGPSFDGAGVEMAALSPDRFIRNTMKKYIKQGV